jgi:biofilm PGA synthesis protein PgaA
MMRASARIACLMLVSAASAQAISCREARAGSDRFTALRICAEARDRNAVGQMLSEMGAPFAAASWVSNPPLAWRADQASKRIRWSRFQLSPDPARRFDDVDLALNQLPQLLAETRASQPLDRPMERRLRLDTVSALRARGRCPEAVEQGRALEAESELPAYTQEALADCLLEMRQPEEAHRRYSEALTADPKNPQARIGLAYAALDMEDARGAYRIVDAIAAENPAPLARRKADSPAEPSGAWLDGQLTAATFRLYADQPAEADRRMRPLINGAPALAYLRADSAKIAAARGQPRFAEQEIRIAAGLSPDDIGIQTEQANSALRRRRWREAGSRYQDLVAQYPEDGGIKRLGRDLATEKMFLLETQFSVNHEKSSNNASPGSSLNTGLKLYSPPVAERWRLIGASDRATAEPVEGKITRNRFGGGLDYRAPDAMVEAMGWANTGTAHDGSASVWGFWEPADAWRLNAFYDYFSNDVPLRALFYDTRGNATGGAIDFEPNESQGASLSLRSMSFSDRNERLSLRLAGAQTLIQRPGLSATLRPELYGSRNTESDVPYFNPSKDAAMQVGFDLQHRLWRRYQKVFSHSLNLGGGLYAQEHFPAGGIGNARYSQSYRIDPLTELRWGVEVSRRIYDGDAVGNLTLSAGWNQRF